MSAKERSEKGGGGSPPTEGWRAAMDRRLPVKRIGFRKRERSQRRCEEAAAARGQQIYCLDVVAGEVYGSSPVKNSINQDLFFQMFLPPSTKALTGSFTSKVEKCLAESGTIELAASGKVEVRKIEMTETQIWGERSRRRCEEAAAARGQQIYCLDVVAGEVNGSNSICSLPH